MRGEHDPNAPGTRPRRPADAVWRSALFVAGWICLAIGIAGVFLPLVPGTLFLIVAAACFARSSPRFEAWLLGHPRLGPPVRHWRETGAIPRYAKVFAVASLVASWLIMLLSDAPDLAKIGCLIAFCAVALYIVKRPEA